MFVCFFYLLSVCLLGLLVLLLKLCIVYVGGTSKREKEGLAWTSTVFQTKSLTDDKRVFLKVGDSDLLAHGAHGGTERVAVVNL